MPLEAVASSELLPGLMSYDRYHGQQQQHPDGPYISALLETLSSGGAHNQHQPHNQPAAEAMSGSQQQGQRGNQQQQQQATGRKKRRRRARVCKNKEEAETQRMTHIAVERNRRRQMNDHLASLRALMPDSYIQRGNQASIVGGAIDFVRELEQLLQSLEVQKHAFLQQQNRTSLRRRERHTSSTNVLPTTSSQVASLDEYHSDASPTAESPFAQFFSYPQYVRGSGRGGCGVRECCIQAQAATAPSDGSNPHQHHQRAASGGIADIEVTLVETHASMRILSPRRPGQLLRMVAGFHAMQLTVLHLNLTTLDPLVLYTVSAKVEEGCSLTTVDDIATAVHHMLTLIEAESAAATAVAFCS